MVFGVFGGLGCEAIIEFIIWSVPMSVILGVSVHAVAEGYRISPVTFGEHDIMEEPGE